MSKLSTWAAIGAANAKTGTVPAIIAEGNFQPVEPQLTIAGLNERNAVDYAQDNAGYVSVSAGAAPELKPEGAKRYGYPAGYPVDPSEGLGSNSVAKIERSNAEEYGLSDQYLSPTNMVGR